MKITKIGAVLSFILLIGGGMVYATAVTVDGIIGTKGSEDTVNFTEFNTLVDSVRGIFNDNKKIGIGAAPISLLSVSGGTITIDKDGDNDWGSISEWNGSLALSGLADAATDRHLTIDNDGVIKALNRFSISYPTSGVNGATSVYSRVNADSFHTTGTGKGQMFIEGYAIDSNSTIQIGTGLAGGQGPKDVIFGQKVTVGTNVNAGGFFYTSSDSRLKENIQSLENSLDKISRLQGVNFDWKKSGNASVGLIAQDVEVVFPEMVSTNEETGMKSVAYGNLVAPIIEAIKELKAENEALRDEVELLKSKLYVY